MFSYIKQRYSDVNTRIRAYAHAMMDGLISGWLITQFGSLGFLGLLAGPILEIYQGKKDGGPRDWKDVTFDLLEHFIGGLAISYFFFITNR